MIGTVAPKRIGDFPRAVTASAVRAAHLDAVLRYWAKQGGSAVVVGLSRAECADLNGGQVPFGTVYEDSSATWMSGGFSAGVKAAQWLKTRFAAAAYTPRAVYCAADSNTISSAAVNDCLDGFASILGRDMTGLYGYLPQLEAAHAGGHAARFWLTGHFPGASVAAVQAAYPWIHLYQCQGSQPPQFPTTVTVAGQVGDGDIGLQEDWGQSGVDVELTDEIKYVSRTGQPISTDVRTCLAHADDLWRQLTKGNGDPGPQNGPAGWWVTQFLTPDHAALARVDTNVQAIQGALAKEEVDLLGAIKAQPVAAVDEATVEAALAALNIPAGVAAALVALINKAATTS